MVIICIILGKIVSHGIVNRFFSEINKRQTILLCVFLYRIVLLDPVSVIGSKCQDKLYIVFFAQSGDPVEVFALQVEHVSLLVAVAVFERAILYPPTLI